MEQWRGTYCHALYAANPVLGKLKLFNSTSSVLVQVQINMNLKFVIRLITQVLNQEKK